jgi:hypothetical protein
MLSMIWLNLLTLLFKINGTPELSVSGDRKTLKPSRSINQGKEPVMD